MKAFSIKNKMIILMLVLAASIGLVGFLSVNRMNAQKESSLEQLEISIKQDYDKQIRAGGEHSLHYTKSV